MHLTAKAVVSDAAVPQLMLCGAMSSEGMVPGPGFFVALKFEGAGIAAMACMQDN